MVCWSHTCFDDFHHWLCDVFPLGISSCMGEKKMQRAMIVSMLKFILFQLIVKFKFIKPPSGKEPVNKTEAKRIENQFILDLTWGILDIIEILSTLGEKDERKRRNSNDKRSSSGFGGTRRR